MKKMNLYTIVGLLTTAVVCGFGGYKLGLRQATSPAMPLEVGENETREARSLRKTWIKPVDLQEVKRELKEEPSQLGRFRIAQNNLERWVAKDPVDALDWLASQSASYRKKELISLALNQFSESDARSAAEWALENLEGGDLNNGLIAVAKEWAQQNGREAAEWFLGLPDTPERDAAVENMMFVWGANEPKAALGFVDDRGDLADLAPTLRRASLAGWSKSDPEAAVAASLEISKKQNDPQQFANTLANWATVDLKSSSDWLMQNMNEGESRTAAAAELAAIFAQQSPTEGVEFLAKLKAGEERDVVGNNFAGEWAAFGSKEAAEWAAKQTSINLDDQAASEIAINYLMQHPDGFARWANSLPLGNLKDAADQAAQLPERE